MELHVAPALNPMSSCMEAASMLANAFSWQTFEDWIQTSAQDIPGFPSVHSTMSVPVSGATVEEKAFLLATQLKMSCCCAFVNRILKINPEKILVL